SHRHSRPPAAHCRLNLEYDMPRTRVTGRTRPCVHFARNLAGFARGCMQVCVLPWKMPNRIGCWISAIGLLEDTAMSRQSRAGAALLLAGLLLPGAGANPTARADLGPASAAAGAGTIGDPYYPNLGNGGYDARHYTLDLKVDVRRDTISGTVTMDAVATE